MISYVVSKPNWEALINSSYFFNNICCVITLGVACGRSTILSLFYGYITFRPLDHILLPPFYQLALLPIYLQIYFRFLTQEQEILQRKNRRSRRKNDLIHMVFGETVEFVGCVLFIV